MEIRKTFNYDLFSFFDFNRTAGTSRNIKKSIEIVDMTMYVPIIVSEDYKIIDGQNRFLACKEMKKPIYYVVYKDDPEVAMIHLNTATQPWRINEWLQYYVGKGEKNYVELNNLMKKYNVEISNAILLYSGATTNSTLFKEGKLKNNSYLFETVVKFIDSTDLPKDIKKYRPFNHGIFLFFKNYELTEKEVSKFRKNIIKIVKFSRVDDYLNAFRNILKK